MHLGVLSPVQGAKHKKRRVARGHSAGGGKMGGRGHKGQKSRTGGGSYAGFEGGQTPIYRRLPKWKGFKNPFRQSYEILNVEDLERFSAGARLDADFLKQAGLLSGKLPFKILGKGKITKAFSVVAHAYSAAAKQKIVDVGGTLSQLGETVR